MKHILSPSVLSCDFADWYQDMRLAEEAGVSCFHFDVMDGMFVPNISFGMPVIKSLRRKSTAFFDVHMMVEQPERYVPMMRDAGADMVTIHAEATRHLDRALSQIRELGMQAGVALNPATPVEQLRCVLDKVDLVLIMSVNPGFGGQSFLPCSLEKMESLRHFREERRLSYHIGVDGGVRAENLPEILEAGADFIIAGSSVFSRREEIQENVRRLRAILENADSGEGTEPR